MRASPDYKRRRDDGTGKQRPLAVRILGGIAVVILTLCVLTGISLALSIATPGNGDAALVLLFVGPILFVIAVVALIVAIVCLR